MSYLPEQTCLRLSQLIFLIAFLFGLGGRLLVIGNMQVIHHDDAYSYITSANHHLDYRSAPFHAFVPNTVWKNLLTPDEFLPLADIASGLAQVDVHPPLYFWLLHIALSVTNDTLHTGALLNIVIELLMLLILFHFAKALRGTSWQAYLVCAVWYLGVGMLDGTFATRQYVLSALFTMLLSYLTYVWYIRPRTSRLTPLHVIALAVVSAGGMLTLYYFALVIIAHLIAVFVWSLWQKDRRILIYIGGLCIGAVIFLVLFPYLFIYYQDLLGQHVFTQASSEGFSYRVTRLGGSLINLFFSPSTVGRVITFVMLMIIGLRVLPSLRNYVTKRHTLDDKTRALLYIICITLCLITLYSLLFLRPATPIWSVGRRYFLSIWIFLAFVPVYGLNTTLINIAITLVFIGVMLGNRLMYTYPAEIQTYQVNEEAIAFDSPIIINSQARGVVLPLINYLDEDASVYVSYPDEMIAQQDEWLPEILVDGGTYIETTRYQATAERNQQVQQIFYANDMLLIPMDIDWKDTQATVYRIITNRENG